MDLLSLAIIAGGLLLYSLISGRLEGTIIVGGPGIEAGSRIEEATLYDLAPTLLDMLGIAVEAGFEGRSLFPELRPESPTRIDISQFTQSRSAEAGADESFRAEEIERLRSLGYVR